MTSVAVTTMPVGRFLRVVVPEGRPDWRDQALCAETDPDEFFPEKGGSTRQAKAVCACCPVRRPCLEFALENDERSGIYGGMTGRERGRLKRGAA
jgi:WhiB family redox-sensing transcriptional regulator